MKNEALPNKKGRSLAPVSVIIPCYRCQDTITRAVTSVAAQTWRPAEVILVDDASDDATPRLLRDLQRRYSSDWIKVIFREENGGPGDTRNTGWEAATQPYLAFLDADDVWHPRKIEVQLQYMQAHPEVAITGNRCRRLQEGELMPPLPDDYTIKPLSRSQLLMSNRLSTPAVMLKRNLEFRFEPAKWHSEDYLLWLKIVCGGHKNAFIDLDLAYICKASYGTGGLSGQLWKMEKGELGTYRRLRNEQLISCPTFVGLSAFSIAKYVKRLIESWLRKVCPAI